MRVSFMIPADRWMAAKTEEERQALRDEFSRDMTPEEIAAREAEVEAEERAYLAARPATLAAYLQEYRWQREQGGITVGGLPVLTRDRDKTLITGKITEALIKSTPDTDTFTFTLGGQDIVMTIGQLKLVGVAIAEHVQRTVDAAALVRPEIASGDLTTPEAVASAFDAAYQSLT